MNEAYGRSGDSRPATLIFNVLKEASTFLVVEFLNERSLWRVGRLPIRHTHIECFEGSKYHSPGGGFE